MVTNLETQSEGAFRWKAIKQSLLLVVALIFSTLVVAFLSTAVQKATYFLSHSVPW